MITMELFVPFNISFIFFCSFYWLACWIGFGSSYEVIKFGSPIASKWLVYCTILHTVRWKDASDTECVLYVFSICHS